MNSRHESSLPGLGAGQVPVWSWRLAWPCVEQAQHLLPPGTIWWWGLSGCPPTAPPREVTAQLSAQPPTKCLCRWRCTLGPAWPQIPALRQTQQQPCPPMSILGYSVRVSLASFSLSFSSFLSWVTINPAVGMQWSSTLPIQARPLEQNFPPIKPRNTLLQMSFSPPFNANFFVCLSAKIFLILPNVQWYLLLSDGVWSKVGLLTENTSEVCEAVAHRPCSAWDHVMVPLMLGATGSTTLITFPPLHGFACNITMALATISWENTSFLASTETSEVWLMVGAQNVLRL